MVFTIDDLRPDQVDTIVAIGDAEGLSNWSADAYREELSRSDAFLLSISDSHGEIIGFAAARVVPGAGSAFDAEIYNIAVRRSSQRHGAGSALIKALITRLFEFTVENVWLEVRKSNKNAITFYARNRFEPVAERPNFYVNPVENAIVLKLSLAELFL